MRFYMICLTVGIAVGAFAFNLSARPQVSENNQPPNVYRAIERLEIDKLGLEEKLPANHSDEKALERGLNIMTADGWDLVAVEGGRMRIFNGGGDAALHIQPTYIFRRASK